MGHTKQFGCISSNTYKVKKIKITQFELLHINSLIYKMHLLKFSHFQSCFLSLYVVSNIEGRNAALMLFYKLLRSKVNKFSEWSPTFMQVFVRGEITFLEIGSPKKENTKSFEIHFHFCQL